MKKMGTYEWNAQVVNVSSPTANITPSRMGVIRATVVRLQKIWENFDLEVAIIRWALLKAQYGDTNYGHDSRVKERRERLLRNYYRKYSQGPIHAGVRRD